MKTPDEVIHMDHILKQISFDEIKSKVLVMKDPLCDASLEDPELDRFDLYYSQNDEDGNLREFTDYPVIVSDTHITLDEKVLLMKYDLFIRTYIKDYENALTPVDIPLKVLKCGGEKITPAEDQALELSYEIRDESPDV